jgi:hypothetical protein
VPTTTTTTASPTTTAPPLGCDTCTETGDETLYDAFPYADSQLSSQTNWSDVNAGTFSFRAKDGFAFGINTDDGSGTNLAMASVYLGADSGLYKADFTMCARIRVLINVAGNDLAGFFFRYLDANNYLMAVLNADLNKFQIRKMDSGSETVLYQTDFTCDDDAYHVLKVVLIADSITASADGTTLYVQNGFSFNQTETTHGIYNYRSNSTPSYTPATASVFDYFRYNQSQTVISDLFSGSASTALSSHTPDTAPVGSSWGGSDDYELTGSGSAGVPEAGSSFPNLAVIESGIDVSLGCSAMEINCSFDMLDVDAQLGVVFRYQDASNYWILILDSTAGTIVLKKIIAGTPTTVASASSTIDIGGSPEALVLWDDGNTIKGGDPGLLLNAIGQTDLNSATKVGLYTNTAESGYSYAGYFDAIEVKELS